VLALLAASGPLTLVASCQMLGRELTSLSHLLLTKDFRYLHPGEWTHLKKAAE
jgi:hypothetical protein